MLEQIISGGQIGVDQAALQAAKDCGFKTGGYAPKGYRTLTGPNLKLKSEFGLVEHPSFGYKERTWANVLFSDGTLRIAENFSSAGEICTARAIFEYKKPSHDIKLGFFVYYNLIIEWINKNNIKILNVAGNSERTSPGIYNKAYNIIKRILEDLKC